MSEHLQKLHSFSAPKLSQSVHREECVYCFESQDAPSGIELCLSCFFGSCTSNRSKNGNLSHAALHVNRSGHLYSLNIRRKMKESEREREESGEARAKMTKLAIVEEREADKYDWSYKIKFWGSNSSGGGDVLEGLEEDPKVKGLVSEIMSSLSSARQSEVKAWEEELEACEHTVCLEPSPQFPVEESGKAHCSSCELTNNLWLCLTCGNLGCGRQQYGTNIAGNGHGLAHYDSSKHPVSVKLGTITPEGNADIHCYACSESRLDPSLKEHLACFGIDVGGLKKTEKSLTELQIEHNLNYDFSLTTADGQALKPLFGEGLTGLKNLGNSCYMASTLQTAFTLPSFKSRYLSADTTFDHAKSCFEPDPTNCVECQIRKVADGLLSGRYAHPSDLAKPLQEGKEDQRVNFQDGLAPSAFKELIGRGHAEFATMKQQDAEEFFTHLLNVVRRDLKKKGGSDPTSTFAFRTEQKLQCTSCHKVRYREDSSDVLSLAVPAVESGKDSDGKITYAPQQLLDCINLVISVSSLTEPGKGGEILSGYRCPQCQKDTDAKKTTKFATFPDTLVIHAKKFQLVGWVPTKLDIPVLVPDTITFNETYLGHGLQPGEEELPEDASSTSASGSASAPQQPEFNEASIAQLQSMGFPLIRCQRALLATGNGGAEEAMEWLFGHMEDPDIDSPLSAQTASGSSGQGAQVSEEQIGMLADMGFSHAQASKALRETGSNAERAVEWLFSHPDDMGDEPTASGGEATAASAQESSYEGSNNVPVTYKLKAFISHKGPSVHSGHYVAHIRHPTHGWVLFNDEKVVEAKEDGEDGVKELMGKAYVYFWEKV